MNDTNNSCEQQLQQQATALHKTLSAYDAGAALSTPQQQQNSAAATVKLSPEEQVETISYTSRDAAAAQQQLYTLIKLPARIDSSSTGNDSSLCASTTAQQQQQSQQQLHQQELSSTTEQNFREHSEHVAQVPASQPHCTGASAAVELEAKRRLLVLAADAMPTITDRNAAVLSSASDTEEETETRVEVVNAAATTTTRISNAPSINNNLRTSKLLYKTNNNDSHSRSNRSAAMVTREILPGTVAAELAGAMANSSSSSNNSAVTVGTTAVNAAAENHKIILKLPKPTTSSNSATAAHAESHGDTDATTSGCSNSSNAEDTRKVEPLKINLHTHTHASHSAHSSHTHSSHAHAHSHHGQSGVVPKITIKPIVKQRNDASASDCSSSSAEDELPGISSLLRGASNAAIPKLTIKSTTSVATTMTTTAECSSAAEPHIVPKLTIRSANEEGGTSHTSIVPKLTIKMSDSSVQQASSLLSPTAAVVSKTIANSPATPSTHLITQAPQPPLPKLTIKTSLDGTSESIISTISPASSCYSSSSSSSSGSATTTGAASSFVATSAVVSCISSAAVANTTVPKLTIKTLCKSSEETVPKLTIKTHATGACVSTSEAQQVLTEDSGGGGVAGSCVGSSNKIPKLTIKTGQEHAVIITQHNDASNAQAIPKLTIKTKSLDLEECSDDSPPEKIPKITIKTNELPAAEAPKFCIKAQQQQNEGDASASSIPKLTISVTNLEASSAPQSPKQSPLVLRRQLTVCSRKPESPERVPKLMISRQDSLTVLNNHCDAVGSEKLVPKLTIKTNSLESGADAKDKLTKFAIKSNCSSAASSSSSHAHQQEEVKIPKLTIKPIPPTQSQSSEESDECMSIASLTSPQAQQTNKVVPKLTIKNLCSPKLKIKAVFDDARTHATATETETASKKCSKSSDVKNVNEPNVSLDARSQNIPNTLNSEQCGQHEQVPIISEHVANGGESSNSQEFCGFNDNTTDSTVEANAVSAAAEEPRRHSDDMDIDEGLQQHDPQVFNNVTHFSANNGLSFAGEHDDNDNAAELLASGHMSHVIDTVDLTSSPSPGSSPAHFNYTDADPQVPTAAQLQKQAVPATLLMECLQRESSVIQTAPPTALQGENTSFLLNQLTAPRSATAKHVPLPPLQPKPQQMSSVHCNNSVKYPQLTERLLANGALGLLSSSSGVSSNIVVPCQVSGSPQNVAASKAETVIDSIEILDSPEGSPRYSLEEATAGYEEHAAKANLNNHVHDGIYISHTDSVDILKRNNNTVLEMHHANHVSLKRHANSLLIEKHMLEHDLEVIPNKLRRIENDTHTMATLTILTNDDESPNTNVFTTSPTMIRTHSGDQVADAHFPSSPTTKQLGQISAPHRSRKQRHEHLLTMPIDEEDPLQLNSNDVMEIAPPSNFYENNTNEAKAAAVAVAEVVTPLPIVKKRGRPKKVVSTPNDAELAASAEKAAKPKLSRVQLLRKRLAIDMVTSEQPPLTSEEMELGELDEDACETPSRRERTLRTPLRNSRRSATPSVPSEKPKKNNESLTSGKKSKRPAAAVAVIPLNEATLCHTTTTTTAAFNHFGGSNSSLSSACSSSSMSSNTLTTTAASAMAGVVAGSGGSLSLATQIDLTMSSSSSSASNGSTTATMTTAQARCNSMLPPTTILSSSDPVPDVIFKANDFSCIMTAASATLGRNIYRSASQDDTGTCGSGADNSGDDSTSSSPSTPTRGRGRGRGSRGGRSAGSARGTRGHRLGRGASAMAKAIASSRPRCVGGLKHTPDPHRLKGLFSPSPQVFEEDTRMSADLSQIAIQIQMEPHAPVKQPDFITNEESQSSMMSNTSILDPNLLASVQNGSAIKRPKKKKMEVCVAEDADFTVGSIAEYDWPPPKGCCPSKNRDTFMIQEQVALYLGIKSFKRKYPDLPRRQVDMEERNWLQEKGLVTERMCDLGITAVWASDVLDIMYTDFYDKYEEYKDFIRQKHLREIEVKHKALGLNVTGRGLQARDRAMLSASKWNVYFNKTRKEERLSCLDMQTLTVNVPLPANAAGTTLVNRPIANAIACAAQAERIPEPPTLLKPRLCEQAPLPENSYALALVPGQFAERYRQYTPLQLRSYPLNTVLDDPCTLTLRLQEQQLKQEEQLLSESDVEDFAEATQTSDAVNANTGVGLTGAAAGTDIGGVSRVTKRLPVRRSRRARMNAACAATAERTKSQCDTASADEQDEHSGHKKCSRMPPNNSSSSTEGSSSDDSTSETDSETDSCSSNSASSSSSSEDEMAPALCGVCQHGQQSNLKKLPEVFIKCYTCRRKVHPSCIEMPHRMVARVRNYNWQCVDCKCCIKCKRKQDSNKMLYCEQCDRGFHIYCLGVRAVPDGRWSCERCSVCVRCGATKPEGLPPPQQQCLSSPNGEKIKPIKHKKVKWINEYRIDHITKLREHCSMMCVPCGRAKTTKRVQIVNSNLNCNGNNGSSSNNGTPVGGSSSHGVATTAANTNTHLPTLAHQQTTPIIQQQHLKLQQQQLLSHNATTQMSPPAAPLSQSATATSTSAVTTSSVVATATLPPPPVVA